MASKTADGTFDRIERERKKTAEPSSSASEDGVSEGKESTEATKPEEYEEGKVIKGEIDFGKVAMKTGYLKARQLLKQSAIAVHQNSIGVVDDKLRASFRSARLKEAILLSNTLGAPNAESVQDKIMERGQAANNIKPRFEGQPMEEAEKEFDMDIAMRKAMIDDDYENRTLLLPEMQLKTFPISLGDTVYLQMAFLRRISMPQNKIQMLLNTDLPQLSLYHLRYIREMNLSGNMIRSLPADFGSLIHIRSLDLSGNSLNQIPSSVSKLKHLRVLNLASNNFTSLNDELQYLDSLEELDMCGNLLTAIPPPIVLMRNLRVGIFNRNTISTLAVQPIRMTQRDLWHPFIHELTGKNMFCNVLTKEKVEFVESYSGEGIEKMKALHVFQTKEKRNKNYARRKFWLSVCGVDEYDVTEDELCNIYYRNNVEGSTQWDMPKEVNLLGLCPALEVLEVNSNMIKDLPSSICNIKTLRRLSVFENKLKELPKKLGALTNLEFFDAHSNDLKLTPKSIVECTSLKTLRLAGNQIVRLPDLLGTLPHLVILDVTSNRLTSLPFSLGYTESLKELHCQENPLSDPPIAETSKGYDAFKWYLRQRLMIDKQGMPPEMEYHPSSVMHEVTLLKPELNQRVTSLIRIASDYSENGGNGYLNLQLLGLSDIPGAVFRMGKKCRKLRLDFNDHLRVSIITSDLSALRLLSMKGCKMPELPVSISNLRRVSQFVLQDNRLETLPSTFTKLRSLTLLDLTNNLLYNIPPGMSGLVNMKTLILEGNCLETIPEGLSCMTVLQVLDVCKNRLVDFPESLCDLEMLKKLNLERNQLAVLPYRLRYLKLVELRIGHNAVEYLPNDLFEVDLGEHIKKFSCCENNLLQMPESLYKVDVEGFLEADFNPLISPPAYILAEGLRTVQMYMNIRKIRKEELEELLEDEDFEVNIDSAFPTASEILEDGTGYLTPLDLGQFDQAVHEYLNGEYFKCPASGVELVMRLSKLREYRETEIYLAILECFNIVLKRITKDKKLRKLYSDAVVMKSERPWGIQKQMMNVWVVSLQCLLKDTPENKIHRKGRPSIMSLIEKELPPMPFPFTVDLLKDSLRLYTSPYGQVADTENFTFPSCDCVGGPKNKPLRHDPCKKAAVVLCLSVYTEEEAERRAVEDDEMYMMFDEMTEDIQMFLSTEEGMKELELEVRRREEALAEDIELRDDIKTGEILKLRNARGQVADIERRKKSFEEQEDFSTHGFQDLSEPIALLNEQNEVIQTVQARIDALDAQIKELERERGRSWNAKKAQATADITQKYCVRKYLRIVKRFRIYASVKELRRPWDGDDGAEFAVWMRKLGAKYAPGTIELDSLDKMVEEDEAAYQKERQEDLELAIQQGRKVLEFDWEDASPEDMQKYKLHVYERYVDSRNVFGAAMAMANAAGDFLSGLSKKMGFGGKEEEKPEVNMVAM